MWKAAALIERERERERETDRHGWYINKFSEFYCLPSPARSMSKKVSVSKLLVRASHCVSNSELVCVRTLEKSELNREASALKKLASLFSFRLLPVRKLLTSQTGKVSSGGKKNIHCNEPRSSITSLSGCRRQSFIEIH